MQITPGAKIRSGGICGIRHPPWQDTLSSIRKWPGQTWKQAGRVRDCPGVYTLPRS